MKIFRLHPVTEGYRVLQCPRLVDRLKFLELPDERVSDRWIPPKVAWANLRLTEREDSDFPYFTIPAMSSGARMLLEHQIQGDGEFLPLEGLDGRFVAFHILSQSEALSRTYSRFESNRVSGLVTMIWEAVFDAASLEGFQIFRLRGAARSFVYVSEDVASLIASAGLIGYRLEECRCL